MTNVRIVGGRAKTHDDIQGLDPNDFEFHDMASEAIHADIPREPSTDVMLAALGDAGLKRVRDAEAERAASGHHTIVYMHVADEWELTAAYVLDAIFGEGKVRVVDPAERALKGGNLNSSILAIAQRTHVALVDPTNDDVDAATVALADVALDLRRLRSEHVESVVRKRFDEPPFAWPRDLSARKFEPLWFDYAVARARCCADVVTLLRAQIAESKRVKLRDDAEAAKETARKAASGRGTVVIRPLRPSSPKLESLEGYGAAGAWGVEFLRDMIDYAQKKIAWADVDAGALLVGPPGTGKTLFATAIAASAGLPLFATSYATWQASGEAHLGTLIKAMRATFEAAAAHAPCIVFIDELDAIPSRGSVSSAKSDGWWNAIVAALLECMDGTLRREGVTVLAACNNDGNIDPAILRSGRLDRRFEIALPDATALAQIFSHHAPDLAAATIAPVATALAGMASGADVARYAREARRRARRDDRVLAGEDLLAVALPPEARSPAIVWRTAVHEAGHAMAYLAAGKIPRALSTIAANGSGGFVAMPAFVEDEQRLTDIEAMVLPFLTGRAAEEVLLGDASAGASSDLEQATAILESVPINGFSEVA